MTNTETRTPLQKARAIKAAANKARAEAAFIAEISQISALAAKIEAAAADHLGYNSEEITWAHQANAADIRARLEAISNILDGIYE